MAFQLYACGSCGLVYFEPSFDNGSFTCGGCKAADKHVGLRLEVDNNEVEYVRAFPVDAEGNAK